jgi:nuclear transport factor 2 (NTF2) superfamily protein
MQGVQEGSICEHGRRKVTASYRGSSMWRAREQNIVTRSAVGEAICETWEAEEYVQGLQEQEDVIVCDLEQKSRCKECGGKANM